MSPPPDQAAACVLVIHRTRGTETRTVRPEEGGAVGRAVGRCPNDKCCAQPFLVVGCPVPQDGDDPEVLKAGAYCCSCRDPVGYLYARHARTIFGAEEDARVLHGRLRVY